jgi:hypothetical protein
MTRITFANIARARPIVLTAYDVAGLSAAVGRDVTTELEAMRAEHFAVLTVGELWRTLLARLRERALPDRAETGTPGSVPKA